MTATPRVSLRLTAEQQAQFERATGRKPDAVELDVERLEDRIAPAYLSFQSPLAEPRPDPFLGGPLFGTLK